MTFDEKFKECVQYFQNHSSPTYVRNDVYLFSDFVELSTVFSKDGEVSFGDIQDRFFGTKEYNSAEERDNDDSLVLNIFMLLQERSYQYGDDYPFSYDNDRTVMKIKVGLNDKQKFYLYLLISSKLNIFKAFKTELTTEFEFVCKIALERYLPTDAVVKNFGRNSAYPGNAIGRIKGLAVDLNLTVDEYELSQVSERNNQERGLDIVGWIPFQDDCMNLLVFLAQCACGKDFESKQHDTRRFKNYLNFYKSNPIHIMFIPYSLINSREKKFYHSDLIEKDYLVFERKRIMDFYDPLNFNTLDSFKVVELCLKYKESIV
ncbi:MAG: hypothetical protein HC819_12045 [Cyclobacteriaceae bacterium]|nr:hypothetical protein [Cyclobacteriaceae bacterium]